MTALEVIRKAERSLSRAGYRPRLLVLVHKSQEERIRAELSDVHPDSLPEGLQLAADPSGSCIRRPGELFAIDRRKYDFIAEMRKPPGQRRGFPRGVSVLFGSELDEDGLQEIAEHGTVPEYQEEVS
jgi:hypothetical protein